MVVPSSSRASTPADIIVMARPSPGTLTFASGGSGTSQHLSGVLFGLATGTDLVHVPYTSAVQAVRAVMTDEVTMGFFNTPLVIEYVRHGELRALGVTSREQTSLLPNVPNLAEQGV
jgi:tripartite-type tricarboxylate transporter receptor subunit TctC